LSKRAPTRRRSEAGPRTRRAEHCGSFNMDLPAAVTTVIMGYRQKATARWLVAPVLIAEGWKPVCPPSRPSTERSPCFLWNITQVVCPSGRCHGSLTICHVTTYRYRQSVAFGTYR
jgi:hypothetical protein